MSTKVHKCRWLGPIGLIVSISIVSGGMPPAPPGPSIPYLDKLIHFLVFGLVATSILRALPTNMRPFYQMLIALVVTSVFGMADELHQSTSPGRSIDIYDWAADTAGALVACIVYQNWKLYRTILEWRIMPKNIKALPQQNSST